MARRPRSKKLHRSRKQKDRAGESAEPVSPPAKFEALEARPETREVDLHQAEAAFAEYYKRQRIVPDADWDRFWKSLHHPLPLCIRFPARPALQKAVATAKAELEPWLGWLQAG